MFGGVGLYQDGVFFGIAFAGRLYFKTDELSRGRYVAEECQPFIIRRRPSSYYEVPARVLESPPELAEWASDAIRVQRST